MAKCSHPIGAAMSHEIALIHGSVGEHARVDRRRRVERAAAAVPNASSWTVAESPTSAVALVSTTPGGGSSAEIARGSDGTIVAIAGSESALERLLVAPTLGSTSGAELTHVLVQLHPGGQADIRTDGVGLIPSFWSKRDGELLFSTSLASLVTLGIDPDPDPQGVLEYLLMMHPLGERTILRQARLLPAGGRISIDEGGQVALDVDRLFTPDADAMSDDEAVRVFRATWADVIGDVLDRSSGSRLAVGLSGGLDSRAIASECVRRGATPMTFTYGTRHTYEGEAAARVAGALGLDHMFLRVSPDRRLREPLPTAALLDGAHSPAEMYEAWFTDRLRSFADVVVNGHAGGPLWGDEKALGLRGEERLVTALERRYAPALAEMRRFLAPDLRSSAQSMLHDGVADSLREWHMGRADTTTFWNVHNRQFRWGNMMPNLLRRSGIRTEAPFLDSRFLAFSRRLTADQRRNGNLYLRIQREVFPETAGIPRSDDSNAPAHLDHVYWSGDVSYPAQLLQLASRHPVSAGRRALRRLRMVGGEKVRARTPLTRFDERLQRRLTPFPADLWSQHDARYRNNLADFLTASTPRWPLDAGGIEHEVLALRAEPGAAGHDAGPLSLAKLATVLAWLADYDRRARTRDEQPQDRAALPEHPDSGPS